MTACVNGPVRFTSEDADRAYETWGSNCGPGAIAAVCGLTLDELRPHMGDFERKRYTNVTLMFDVLNRLTVFGVESRRSGLLEWPIYGLARVQWDGPWTAPGVHRLARLRYSSNWVGARVSTTHGTEVFDINCMSVGGWVSLAEWRYQVVPWLLKEIHPRANGQWHLTHVIEVFSQAVRP